MNPSPLAWYEQRLTALHARLTVLQKKDSWLGWLRFFALAIGVTLAWILFSKTVLLALALLLLFLVLFVRLVYLDADNAAAIRNLQHLISITEQEIRQFSHEFSDRPDGSDLLPAGHDYGHDLDIFGSASLFQYLNRAESDQGKRTLAEQLLAPADPGTLPGKQAAARELATDPVWMQQLLAYGRAAEITLSTEARISHWLHEPFRFSVLRSWAIIRWVFPLAGVSLVALFAAGIVPESRFYLFLTILFFSAILISKQITPLYNQLNRLAPAIETLSNSLAHIEQRQFRSDLLLQLQLPLRNNAAIALQRLQKILARLDYRLNPMVSVPLNALFAWDLQQGIALENWKRRHQQDVLQWFAILGQMEALVSVGTLHFNQPDWVFPGFSATPMHFHAKDIGHPLIPAGRRVCSDFDSEGRGQLALITGSNMAGKSTFLRTIGTNTVLAMMGAPVCARQLTLAPMRIMSSMRIADNLEESTSTFYAELKKLKTIIEAVNQHQNVFLLLDEILRGTNSADRHTGSEALIRQLIREDAAGILATHDLALAKLETDFPGQLVNYHFDVQVAGEELFFDYQLKPGICTSMNASILMKKIGINM